MEFEEKTAGGDEAALREKLKEAQEAAEALRGEVERLSKANDLSKMTLSELAQSQRAAPQFPVDTALKMEPGAFYDAVKNHLDGQLASLPPPRLPASLIPYTKSEIIDGSIRVLKLHEQLASASEGQKWTIQKQLEQERETLAHNAKSLGCVPILRL